MSVSRCFKESFACILLKQEAVCCKPLTKVECADMISLGCLNVLFGPLQVLGKNKTGHLLQEIAHASGVKEWKKKMPHTL